MANLNTVKASRSKSADESQRLYFAGQALGTRSGAIAVVHITRQREVTTSIPSSSKRRLEFDVEIEVVMKSRQLTAEAARADFDALIDAVCARVRSDRQLGTNDTTGTQVWQAAEDRLDVEYDDFRATKEFLEFWALVKFELTQYTP